MKFLENILKNARPHFEHGGKLERFHSLFDAMDTFMFTPTTVTQNGPHIRDNVDMKRYMITVVLALVPALLLGIYNAGYQSARAFGEEELLTAGQIFANGAFMVLPIIIVSYAVGGFWEVLFGIVRKHPINEGFLVSGILFPLTLPPTIPLWQAAIGISFGVVMGKEIFGGTGMNILNPALTGRVFLFFSYPAGISGDKVWVNLDPSKLLFHVKDQVVDGFTGATALLSAGAVVPGQNPIEGLQSVGFHNFALDNLYMGLIPGSIGETSAFAILIGAAILILTGVGSWQIMVSTVAGLFAMSGLLNVLAGPELPASMALPPLYHLAIGGFMFGTVFMATDPVSASGTSTGKYIYGFMIGVLTVLVRVWNPAYPEGIMLSILFMNIFSPTIDYFVIQSHIRRRMKRAKAQ